MPTAVQETSCSCHHSLQMADLLLGGGATLYSPLPLCCAAGCDPPVPWAEPDAELGPVEAVWDKVEGWQWGIGLGRSGVEWQWVSVRMEWSGVAVEWSGSEVG